MSSKPTPENYNAYQAAFDFFNDKLFKGSVPQLLVTHQRRKSFKGFFGTNRFQNEDGILTHELAMNPDYFSTDRTIMSTFVHEMVHAWQSEHGKPGRGRYHNRYWALKMKEVGLYPSSTGQPGGKETGDRVSHYIIEAGPYDKAFDEFERNGFRIPWGPRRRDMSQETSSGKAPSSDNQRSVPKPDNSNRLKYRCACGDQAWGKPGLEMKCLKCESIFKAVLGFDQASELESDEMED